MEPINQDFPPGTPQIEEPTIKIFPYLHIPASAIDLETVNGF